MSELQIVRHDDDGDLPTPHWETAAANPAKIPQFEGQDVNFATAKLTSVSNLEIEDRVLKMDEMVRMFVIGRVVNVSHAVNERTGNLVRVQTIKVIEGEIVDWSEE